MWRVFCLALCLTLPACVQPPGPVSSAPSSLADLQAMARAGDPVAQTALGDRTCCSGRGRSYAEATKWYCEAATLGHADAYYRLGQVYSGRAGRTLLGSSRQLRLTPARRDNGLAFFYFSQAARLGSPGAQEEADSLKLDAEDRLSADGYMAEPSAAPCLYDDVFQP
ncbi:MAG: sel1 repeat family protein [Rhodobiaceae bacterium]|nr:sel1 repeat family protein [Rhodobiaceae bacterium]